MSLYWPEQKVAVEIVDDSLAQPFDRAAHPDVRVLQVTCDELDNWVSSMQFMDKVCDALGQPRPSKTPQWLAANHRLHKALTCDTPKYWR
ncbi:hypothetical protein [Thermophilibacter provencensis]|uniref:Uncharacterized protein n=1 Tax=Thermophilibacter provencensis TaxID=1852386 RepID=A0ABT7V623_9ACTN|nr:hypothetical protein [Thermophilibacter provencensis]MDM8271446.1 hypothetical protein [Thermophilibacter provencensis]